ncbi:MAG: DNA topoisomerase IV subunit B [Alphaproteobacteria bacterium]
MSDLFSNKQTSKNAYTAKDIEVLEGLEPVRRRPGMYIGGVDENALHHLIAEILDNSMDEAVAGYANTIEVSMHEDGSITISDNGRGIPVDPHPSNPEKSALEVIMTTLHSGGKFGSGAYTTSGGLHGVGISVVNALSEELTIEVARDKTLWRQKYSRGLPTTTLEEVGKVNNRRGTSVTFKADPEIFGFRVKFRPGHIYRMARSKAYLFRGVQIKWQCAPSLISEDNPIPSEAVLVFPNGLEDFLNYMISGKETVTDKHFAGIVDIPDDNGKIEWALNWASDNEDGFFYSYCNTVPTPFGGTHENGFKTALTKSLKAYAEMSGNRKASNINADDMFGSASVMLSLFMKNPQFQGQTKEKLTSPEATKYIEPVIKDMFDHWLSSNTTMANALLDFIIERAEYRQKKRKDKELNRKSATKRLRLPGKLADCSRSTPDGTEIFIVEGDSAGGSAKQARNRETQAILPIRGKILNVASATSDKIMNNQEIKDIIEALGCGTRNRFNIDGLRYEKIIIMTDADVDGAHIASLLMTFFYQEMKGLIENGNLYLALPPLYRLTHKDKTFYAFDDSDKETVISKNFAKNTKVEVSRFKGLGEMPAAQLKETTMSPLKRTLLRVTIPHGQNVEEKEEALDTARRVEHLMGKKPELRFKFIQERAKFIESDNLDI